MSHNLRPYRGILPTLADAVYVDPSAVVIGRVELGDDVSVWPMSVIRGDVNVICIGARSNVQDGSVLHVSRPKKDLPNGFPTLIGEDTTIGHKVMLHGCVIGDRVLIGNGCVILDGVVIEDDVMVGAGSLVTPNKRLQSGFLYTGSPARQTRALSEGEIKHLQKNASNYVELKNEYLAEGAAR